MKSFFNQANLYILLWCLYYMQGSLYPSGSIISQLFLIVVLLMSFYNVYIANFKYKLPTFLKRLNLLLVMFTIYGLILILNDNHYMIDGGRIPNISYIKAIYISLLPIYSSYVYSLKGQISLRTYFYWIPIWLVVATLYFYYEQTLLLEELVHSEESTNNIAYFFLALMPSFSLLKSNVVIQVLGLIYCMIFMLVGMKRGAIVLGGLTFFWFLYQRYKYSKRNTRYLILILVLAVFSVMIYAFRTMLETSLFFNERIEETIEGDSSGRDNIYGYFWNYFWNKTDFLNMLFGNGANATLSVGSNYAHNDWLEILINQGILGVVIYFMYIVGLFKMWYKSRSNPLMNTTLGMIFIIVFFRSVFSMSYSDMTFFLTLPLGSVIAFSKCKIYK